MPRRTLLIAFGLMAGPGVAHADPAPPAAANPAAALCIKDGAKIEMETAPNGSQHGICVFPSGSRINEWAYFRNKHRTLR